MRLKKGLVKKVELRTAPGVFEERHATWLELFYDLAFVAAMSQVSSALSGDFSWTGVVKYLALFIPIWWAWVGQAFYLSRFDSDDLVHRLFALLQIVIVASISVNIPRAFDGYVTGFALSYAALRFVLVLQYLIAGFQIPTARKLTTQYAVGFGIAAALWAVSVLVPSPWNVVIWAVAIMVDFTTPYYRPTLSIKIPPDYSHIPERFGLFTIIVLGEAILAVIFGLRAEHFGKDAAVISTLGLVLAFALWWIYFDGVKGHQVQIPKQRKDLARLQAWLFCHLPLTASIVIAAVGIKHAIPVNTAAPMHAEEGNILATAVLVVFSALHAIYWAGLNPKLTKIVNKLSWPHWITTLAVIPVVAFGGQWNGFVLVAVLNGLALLHVFWTLRDLPETDELLRRVESARHQTAGNV